jgi:hypothetical protein
MLRIEELQMMIPGLDEEKLEVVAELERAAVAYVETQTRRYFGPLISHTEVVRGNGSSSLYLAHYGVDSAPDDEYDLVVAVVDERQYPGNDPNTVEDYELRALDGETVLMRHAGAPWIRGYEYTVTYTRGYVAGEEPADIRQVVINLVKAAWESVTDDENLRSETIGGYSYVAAASNMMDATDKATIDAWRRLVIA